MDLYLVALRWTSGTTKIDTVDSSLDQVGEWFRFNGVTWFVWTDFESSLIRSSILPRLDPADSLLIIKMDGRGVDGFAPPMVWEWLNPKILALRDQRSNAPKLSKPKL
jgi:hypothetical protein